MKISDDTKQILEFLDYTSSGTLRKRNDLGAILEVLATHNQPELANEIIFYGSALWGSYQIYKRNDKTIDTTKLKNEIENLFDKIANLLERVVEIFEDKNIIDRFYQVYLQYDTGAKMNIIDLCYDLNELKKVQLKLKGKK